MDIILAAQQLPRDLQLAKESSNRSPMTPGEVITDDTNYIRGHGTYVENGCLIAAMAGYISRVNKLLTITPLRQVYEGAVGDSLVGRITQVQNTRWKVDVHSRLDAELKLANIHMPGGEQRRKDIDDERGMRGWLKEGDLVCVEVQKVGDDGQLKLAARTSKFGKLGQGTLVSVSPSLLLQDKQRIHDLPYGARVIFGVNGYIFITPCVEQEVASSYTENYEEVDEEVRAVISRLTNVINLLAVRSVMISTSSVMSCYDLSIERGIEIKELLRPDTIYELAYATISKLSEG